MKKQKVSPQTVEDASRVAKATQKPGQTKEQTKLIAQGIQKGIEQYKKQQKEKARELDKRLKKARNPLVSHQDDSDQAETIETETWSSRIGIGRWLPWLLLVLSWLYFLLINR